MQFQTMMNALVFKAVQEEMAQKGIITIGELILKMENISNLDDYLVALPDERFAGEIDSYRGHYDHLAIGGQDGPRKASSFLEELRSCLGKEFKGYKGGEFIMNKNTPIWVADYSCCGEGVLGIQVDEAQKIISIIAEEKEARDEQG